jgi:hypothetical protein
MRLDSTGALTEQFSFGEGSNSHLRSRNVAIDSAGNQVVVSDYSGSISVTGQEAALSYAASGYSDSLLCKLGPTGNVMWAKNWGGLGEDNVVRVTVDSKDGIYVAGRFQDSVDLDPGPGVDLHKADAAAQGNAATYLSKFTADGDYVWGNSWTDISTISAIVSLTEGRVCLAGEYSSGSSLEQGSWTKAQLVILGVDGQIQQTLSIGESMAGYQVSPEVIAASAASGIYLSGSYTGSLKADPEELSTQVPTTEARREFLLAMSDTLRYEWIKTWDWYGGPHIGFMGCDTEGNLILYGRGPLHGFPLLSEATRDSPGSSKPCQVLMKVDSKPELLWLRTWGSAGANPRGLGIDENNGIYLVGSYGGTQSGFDFDPASPAHRLPGRGGTYVSKFDPEGELAWVWMYGWPSAMPPSLVLK